MEKKHADDVVAALVPVTPLVMDQSYLPIINQEMTYILPKCITE